MVLVDPDQPDALAMLLDFKKAYDSLDRNFMVSILRQHGYPEKFVQAVRALHDGTHVRFLANGTKSRRIHVTSGIRQGCPLAPLLFILALEPLYRRLDDDTTLKGVVIQSEAGKLELRVAGYADDTAVYLRSPEDARRMRTITQRFGEASGLQLNEAKTLVIALNPHGPDPATTLPMPFQYQGHGIAGRYLGIQVGSGVLPARTWDVAETQLRVRLALACQKTSTVDQRSLIAAAVIVPKLTFIAQHAWPTTTIINRFARKIRNYVWHATFAEDVDGSRAWLDADMAALDRASGGLAIPDLRAELLAMAAAAVSKWARSGSTALHIVGDVLCAPAGKNPKKIFLTPNALPRSMGGGRVLTTMWATGRKLATLAGGQAQARARASIVAALRVLADAFGLLTLSWEADACRVDGVHLLGSVFGLGTRTLDAEEGSQCLEWLPEAGLADLHLFQASGELLPVAPGIPARGRISDVIAWTLEKRGVLWVRPCRPAWRDGGQHADWLENFIVVLITNFPALLTQRVHSAEVRMIATPADHPIIATVDTGRLLTLTASSTHTITTEGVTSQVDLETRLVSLAGTDVKIHAVHPHPSLSRRVSLRLEGRRKPHPRKHYKRYAQHASNRRGKEQARQRAAQWTRSSDAAGLGLATLEWTRIRRIPGLNPWGEQVLFRLKASAFSMYDVRNGRVGCPHSQCRHAAGVDIYHVFWTCPAARRLRTLFIAPWTRLGLVDAAVELACFSLELPEVPLQLRESLADADVTESGLEHKIDECLTALAEGCWRLGAATYFHAVWRWRVEHFDDTNDVSAGRHLARLTGRLRQGYMNIHFYMNPDGRDPSLMAAARAIRHALLRPWSGPSPMVPDRSSQGHYFLFFDGGSRGNPGPGGAGAVVVRPTLDGTSFRLEWAASMSYAATNTTNNMAENLGLLAGLTACRRYGFSPLRVVGDSEMIVRQHRTRKPPKAHHLIPLYWRCRRQLTGVNVITWHHHLRDFNKMADWLANRAMDSKHSTQLRFTHETLMTDKWMPLVNLAGGDMEHWTLNNMEADALGAVAAAP